MHIPGWQGTHYVVQAGLELVAILLSQPPECCKFRHKPLYLHTWLFLVELICLSQSCLSSPETSFSLSACPLCCAAPGEPDLRRYIPPHVPSAWCRVSHTAGPQSQVGNGSAFSQVEQPIRRSAPDSAVRDTPRHCLGPPTMPHTLRLL